MPAIRHVLATVPMFTPKIDLRYSVIQRMNPKPLRGKSGMPKGYWLLPDHLRYHR